MKMNFNKDTESPADDDLGIRGRRERDINKIANTILKYYSTNANSPLHINRIGDGVDD
jgi:hypothetical protein